MRPWRDFFPEVLPFIRSDIPDPMIERQLLRSTQKFCEITRAWKVELEPIITVAGEKNYDIEFPAMCELVRIENETRIDGQHLDLWRPGSNNQGGSTRKYIFTRDRKTVDLGFSPSDKQEILLVASLKPSLDAAGAEDPLFDQYCEEIARGAVARLNADPISEQAFVARCQQIATQIWRGSAAINPRAHANWF